MPTVSLTVPHFEQELPNSCVPACVRMVLAFYGNHQSESDLRSLLGTGAGGTPPRALFQLSSLGFRTQIRTGSLPQIQHLLGSGIPPIVFLSTGSLPYWATKCDHAAIVVGITDTEVLLSDPAFATAPQRVAHADFLQAWALNNHTYAAITPRAALASSPP